MTRDDRWGVGDPPGEPVRPPAGRPAGPEPVGRAEPLDTPRRYDQPIEEDDDPVMPEGDSTLTTKI
jgi:hypothetical protein